MIPSRARTTLLAVICSCVLVTAAIAVPAAAGAKTIGIVPPDNPAQNCAGSGKTGSWTLAGIDRCRAAENVGPLRLPRNWSSLTVPEQTLVLIDLERVNRGLAPILGLSPEINRLAQEGATADDDPGFPKRGFMYGSSIWAGIRSVIAADYGWMYDDGYSTAALNVDCTSVGASGCWAHRDAILMRQKGTIVGGGGYVPGSSYNSYTFEILADYSSRNLTFTWKSELRFFKSKPTLEPLK